MKSYIGIYKSDGGWLDYGGEWVMSPVIWWDYVLNYYDTNDDDFFNNLLQQTTKNLLLNFWYTGDVKDIWVVPFDNEDQIYWTDAIRLS